jgi:hypothetical protein
MKYVAEGAMPVSLPLSNLKNFSCSCKSQRVYGIKIGKSWRALGAAGRKRRLAVMHSTDAFNMAREAPMVGMPAA